MNERKMKQTIFTVWNELIDVAKSLVTKGPVCALCVTIERIEIFS